MLSRSWGSGVTRQGTKQNEERETKREKKRGRKKSSCGWCCLPFTSFGWCCIPPSLLFSGGQTFCTQKQKTKRNKSQQEKIPQGVQHHRKKSQGSQHHRQRRGGWTTTLFCLSLLSGGAAFSSHLLNVLKPILKDSTFSSLLFGGG